MKPSAIWAGVGLAFAAIAAGQERPNIVFILADDVRWDDLGNTGHPFWKTPHIDRIAKEERTTTSGLDS